MDCWGYQELGRSVFMAQEVSSDLQPAHVTLLWLYDLESYNALLDLGSDPTVFSSLQTLCVQWYPDIYWHGTSCSDLFALYSPLKYLSLETELCIMAVESVHPAPEIAVLPPLETLHLQFYDRSYSKHTRERVVYPH